MSTTPQPLTRDGAEPARAGRAGVSAAMRRLLDEGAVFCDAGHDLDIDLLRAWAARLSSLASDLSDCVEAPARNRGMETLCLPALRDDISALYALRVNVAGESARGLGVTSTWPLRPSNASRTAPAARCASPRRSRTASPCASRRCSSTTTATRCAALPWPNCATRCAPSAAPCTRRVSWPTGQPAP